MPLYAVYVTNKSGAESIRAANLPAHHDYLAANAADILIGGATLDDDEAKAAGALYIIDKASITAAWAFANEDPLTLSGARAQISVYPWRTAVIDREYVFGTERAGAPIPGQAPPLPRQAN
jgi:uncharacterized protein